MYNWRVNSSYCVSMDNKVQGELQRNVDNEFIIEVVRGDTNHGEKRTLKESNLE